MADISFPKPTEAVESEKINKVVTATIDDVAIFDGNGNIADSNKTLGKSVPSDAVFTDTTYGVVTKSSAGLCPVLPNESSTSKYLRQDGAWVSPPNDNTTYSFSNNSPTLAWSTTSTIGTVGETALTVTMPANPNTNTTYAFSNNAPTLAWNTTSTIGTVGGVALTVKLPANPNTNTTYSFSNSAPTLSWGATSTVGTCGGVALTVTMPSNPNTNTTYNFSGTTFYSGNSSTAEHNCNSAVKNGTYYYTSNGPATSIGASTTDGALYVQSYSDSWVGQIAQDYRNGNIFVRGKNNGTWQSWKKPDAGSVNGYTVAKSVPSNAVFTDTNTTYAFTNKAPTLAWNTTSTVGVAGGVAFTVKMPANPDTNTNTTYSFTDKSPTLAWSTKSTVGVAGGTAFTVTMPANPNTNTWRGIQNNLTSTSTTDSLSANQGRILANNMPGIQSMTIGPNTNKALPWTTNADQIGIAFWYHDSAALNPQVLWANQAIHIYNMSAIDLGTAKLSTSDGKLYNNTTYWLYVIIFKMRTGI